MGRSGPSGRFAPRRGQVSWGPSTTAGALPGMITRWSRPHGRPGRRRDGDLVPDEVGRCGREVRDCQSWCTRFRRTPASSIRCSVSPFAMVSFVDGYKKMISPGFGETLSRADRGLSAIGEERREPRPAKPAQQSAERKPRRLLRQGELHQGIVARGGVVPVRSATASKGRPANAAPTGSNGFSAKRGPPVAAATPLLLALRGGHPPSCAGADT
jgi:hypothetical protein